MSEILVEPAVSLAKFNRELAQYRELQDEYIRRGWWMVKSDFPTVFVVFGTSRGLFRSVVFGALIDFTNYDLWPPSVKLADPFTMVPYKASQLPYPLFRKPPLPPTHAVQRTTPGAPNQITSPIAGGATSPSPDAQTSPTVVPAQPLAQSWSPDEVPFICLPGIREYHQNPAHSGDSWLLHRKTGEGTLHFILDQLYKYGVKPLQLGAQLNVVFQPTEIPT